MDLKPIKTRRDYQTALKRVEQLWDAAAGSPEARKWALGYVHPLSKRTALYTAAAHVSNDGPSAQALNGAVTAPGKSSRGFDVGIRHNF